MGKVNVGDKIGMLTVLEKRCAQVKTKGESKTSDSKNGKTVPAWHCRCDCGNEVTVKQSTLLRSISTIRSCGKCEPVKNPYHTDGKMTFEEKQAWDKLYAYVKTDILGYDNEQALPSNIVARLQGLLHGKYMANNKSENMANYSYETVLNTFKYCKPKIQEALRVNNFRDETHRFNYIAKIIENNINDVYIRMKNMEKAKERAVEEARRIALEASNYNYTPVERKPKKKEENIYADFW